MSPIFEFNRRRILATAGSLFTGAAASPVLAGMRNAHSDDALPTVPDAVGNYVPYRQVGSLLYIAGQIAVPDGRVLHPGIVPNDVSIEAAREAARRCALQILAIAQQATGSLNDVRQVVRVEGFVASASDFTDQPKIIDAASDTFVERLGEKGRHTRVAVGVSALPKNASVEISAIFEISQ